MTLDLLLLIGALVVLAALLATKIGERLGLPSLILFLALGIILSFNPHLTLYDAKLAHDLGFAALVLILIEGGLSTKWAEIRPVVVPAVLLASVGIGITIGLQALFGFYVLGIPLAAAVLLAAILAPTDSAAVFSVLRHVPLPAKVRSVLEGESGLNDAPTVLLVTAATQLALGHMNRGSDLWVTGALIIGELAGGIALGVVFGFIGVQVLRRLALPASGLYPLAVIGWAVAAYGLGVVAHVSGFAAVYVCAVLLGNGKLPHRHAARSFADGIAWIAQIGLFVMLGLLTHIWTITPRQVLVGILGGIFLTVVVRPVAVWICTVPFRWPRAVKIFVSWGGLRGAVPIVLATIPMEAGLIYATEIFDITFVAVVFLTIINGPTLPWVAKKLGLAGDPLEVDIEVAPLDIMEADMVTVTVSEHSRLHGVAVFEVGLPKNTQISLIIRGDKMFTPQDRDIIRTGDQLLIVCPSAKRTQVEERLRLIDRSGRLGGWLRRSANRD